LVYIYRKNALATKNEPGFAVKPGIPLRAGRKRYNEGT
jgi:hypothetical protein